MKIFARIFVLCLFFSTLTAASVDKDFPVTINVEKSKGDVSFTCEKLKRTQLGSLDDKAYQEFCKISPGIIHFDASSSSIGKIYTLCNINIKGQCSPLTTFQVDSNGKLGELESGKLLETFIFCLGKFANGEPSIYILMSDDNEKCGEVTLIANPIEFKFKDGASIALQMQNLVDWNNGEVFKGTCQGFQPNEKLSFTSISSKEKLHFSNEVDTTGAITAMLFPAVIGKKGGSATFEVQRANSSEKAILKYKWGVDAFKNN